MAADIHGIAFQAGLASPVPVQYSDRGYAGGSVASVYRGAVLEIGKETGSTLAALDLNDRVRAQLVDRNEKVWYGVWMGEVSVTLAYML
jgi:hypothetical protein